eukprot:6983171-Pyramimonas_sp.AAC.1
MCIRDSRVPWRVPAAERVHPSHVRGVPHGGHSACALRPQPPRHAHDCVLASRQVPSQSTNQSTN